MLRGGAARALVPARSFSIGLCRPEDLTWGPDLRAAPLVLAAAPDSTLPTSILQQESALHARLCSSSGQAILG